MDWLKVPFCGRLNRLQLKQLGNFASLKNADISFVVFWLCLFEAQLKSFLGFLHTEGEI